MAFPSRVRAAAALAALALLAACGGGGGTETAVDTGNGGQDGDGDGIVIAVEGEPSNLNPVFGDVFGSFNGDHWPIFSSLLSYDADLDLQPDLAAEPLEISDDGQTVTVSLRDDVTWHDGEPFTAEDVVFTYESILDPDVATGLRDQLFQTLEGVRAVDEDTVEFTLSRLDPAFPDKLTVGIVPVHLLEGEDLNTAAFNVAPVGTGPFVFGEFREGERLVVTANDDYHGGEVGLSRVVFTFVEDENVRVSRLEAGEIDVDAVGLTPRIAQRFADEDRYDIVSIPGEQYSLRLPSENPVFADARVRRAVGLAIDRSALATGLFGDGGRPAFGPFQPQHWAYDPGIEYEHDPEEAASLLDEAGWTEGADGVRERDGEPMAFTYVHGSDPLSENTALFIADALRALGMEVELEVVADFRDRSQRLADGAVANSRPGNAFDPELEVYNAFHSENLDDDIGTNPTRIDDPDVDAAIEAGRSTIDRDERREAYADLQRALQADGSQQFLVQRDYQVIVGDQVEGLDTGVLDSHLHGWSRSLLWNLHEWSEA